MSASDRSLLSLRTHAQLHEPLPRAGRGADRGRVDHVQEVALEYDEWYANPNVWTFKLRRLPRLPDRLQIPTGRGAQPVDYINRGWCFCESSVSNLIKSGFLVLDLGKFDEERMKDWFALQDGCRANRDPPLTPSEFRPQLATKSFTSKNADEEMVNRLFENGLTRGWAR